jgi:hypothetical protein
MITPTVPCGTPSSGYAPSPFAEKRMARPSMRRAAMMVSLRLLNL